MVPAAELVARARPHPADRAARGHRRVQPRRRHRASWSTPTGRGASTACRSACSRPPPTCSPALGRTHDRDNVERSVAHGPGGRASRRSTSTSSTAGRASRSTTGAAPSTTRSPSTRPTCRAYALTVEAGTPLAAGPGPPPRRRRPGRQVPRRHRAPRCRRARLVRDLELEPARPRVPAQPPLLDDGRVPGHRLRLPLPPRRAPVLEPPHPRPLHRRGRERRHGGGGRRAARRRRPGPRGAAALAAHSAGRARGRARRRTSCPAWSSPTGAIRIVSCSPSRAGSSPTRWRCA